MAERFGQAFWPGVNGFVSCSYTCSHGIAPGIASLEVPEQDPGKIPLLGDLIITDGVGKIRLHGAKITSWSLGGGAGSPRTLTLYIADRRWRWAFGAVAGYWNQIDPYPDPSSFPDGEFTIAYGPFAPGTYRPANLLMGDCLTALNERFLIDPSPTYPVPAQWEWEPAASALSQLCDQLGYRVCYQPIANRVLIAPAGVGTILPHMIPMVSGSKGCDSPERPNTLILIGGPTVYHDYLALEPVGQEQDGTFVPINDLSYKPANGWSQAGVPPWFDGVQAGKDLTRNEALDLAKRHVWRTFRVKLADVRTNEPGFIDVGGYGKVYDRKQIVLLPHIHGLSKAANGQPTTEPPYLSGSVYLPSLNVGTERLIATSSRDNTVTSVRLPHKVQIDSARGLVMLDQPAFYRSTTGGTAILAPDLYLYTGFQIRSARGLVPNAIQAVGYTPANPDPTIPPEYLRHPEIVEILRTRRTDTGNVITEVISNRDDLADQIAYHIQAANARYEAKGSEDRTYAGIIGIEPDGAIQQVTWSVGGGQPAITRASRNNEHALFIPRYPERRRNENSVAFSTLLELTRRKGSNPATAMEGSVARFPIDTSGLFRNS